MFVYVISLFSAGGAEKVTGKMTGNSDMVNEGEMRAVCFLLFLSASF